MRPSHIKFPVLHPGMKGSYLCPQCKFQNPIFIEYSRPVIWYSGTKSPCWKGRMPWKKTNAGIYLS